jgi:hypothetical protein
MEDPSEVCKYYDDSKKNYFNGSINVKKAFANVLSTCIFAYRQLIRGYEDFKKTFNKVNGFCIWLTSLHQGKSLHIKYNLHHVFYFNIRLLFFSFTQYILAWTKHTSVPQQIDKHPKETNMRLKKQKQIEIVNTHTDPVFDTFSKLGKEKIKNPYLLIKKMEKVNKI